MGSLREVIPMVVSRSEARFTRSSTNDLAIAGKLLLATDDSHHGGGTGNAVANHGLKSAAQVLM